MLFDRFKEEIERGQQGHNMGLLTSLTALNLIMYGVQKKTYYLVGAEIKTGKSAFVDQVFVLDAYDFAIKNGKKLKVFYYSLEIDALSKISKWAAVKAFRDKGIITSTGEILSKGGYKITDQLKKIMYDYQEHFERMFDTVHILDSGMNPTVIWTTLHDYCEANGSWQTVKKIIGGKEVEQRIYKQNNPDEYVIVVVDHIGLLKLEKRDGVLLNKKQTIDRLSEYCIRLRNNYGVTPVLVSQFNRSLADIDRQRFKELRPLISDFKETGNPSEDANCIIALFQPFRYNIPTYMDGRYKINKLNARFNSAHILANRDGDAGAMIGLNFLGECGLFRQFPQRELTEVDYEAAVKFRPFPL